MFVCWHWASGGLSIICDINADIIVVRARDSDAGRHDTAGRGRKPICYTRSIRTESLMRQDMRDEQNAAIDENRPTEGPSAHGYYVIMAGAPLPAGGGAVIYAYDRARR